MKKTSGEIAHAKAYAYQWAVDYLLAAPWRDDLPITQMRKGTISKEDLSDLLALILAKWTEARTYNDPHALQFLSAVAYPQYIDCDVLAEKLLARVKVSL